MAVLKILRMGHPLLRMRSEKVDDPASNEVKRLVSNMISTLNRAKGAGLAAPQVGVLKRVVIFRVPKERIKEERNSNIVDLTVLVNPKIKILTKKKEMGWEGCLSVPGLRGIVSRFYSVRYSGYTTDGKKIIREAKGFHARVVQHECDHLDGVLYPMRMKDMSSLSFTDQLDPEASDLVQARLDTAGSIR